MCSDRRDAEKNLDSILEGMLNSIEDASPEDVAQELRANGEDLNAIGAEVKDSLLAAVKRFEQRRLTAAREAYKSRIETQSRYVLPATPKAQREQLLAIMSAKPQMAAMLTAQHRNFENLSDEDIKSALEELAELGVFEDQKPDESQ
jgi:hypothetical protein